MTNIKGATYDPHPQPVTYTKKQWQEIIRQEKKKGCKRRYDRDIGETFIHGPDGKIRHEIYANVSEPKS